MKKSGLFSKYKSLLQSKPLLKSTIIIKIECRKNSVYLDSDFVVKQSLNYYH